MENIEELIDGLFEKARPVGTASGPIDKNKYIQKKVPVQRDGKTVMVTKYFDPSKGDGDKTNSSKKKESNGDSSNNKSSSNTENQNQVIANPKYNKGDFVRIISDSIGAIVQGSKRDSKKNEFVLSVLTQNGADIEVYEKDVEKVTSVDETEKITKESIINGLKNQSDQLNDQVPFSQKTKVLKDCIKAAKNGIVNVLVFGDSLGKNKLIEKFLFDSGARKNTKEQKIDKVLSISDLNLKDYEDEDSLESFIEKNSKSVIVVKDFDGRLNEFKKLFKSAIDNTIINVNFDGIFIFNTNESLEALPDELKGVCVCVDLSMSDEIKKGMLIVYLHELDGSDEDKINIIKSFIGLSEGDSFIQKSSICDLPSDCIIVDSDEFEILSGREITENNFEMIDLNGKKIYKIKT